MVLLENSFKEYFKYAKTITKEDLSKFYLHEKPYLTDYEIFWLIYSLKQEKIIKEFAKDTYQLIANNKANYSPKIDTQIITLRQELSQILALTDYCIWSSNWFNAFVVHQVMRDFVLIEVEYEAAEAVFHLLRDHACKDVFLILHKSDEVLLERYVFEVPHAIIVKKIISKSPIQKIIINNTEIKIPKLEKMLVDLFCDEQLFPAYKGYEQQNIFENVLNQYEINFKTMFGYAERRKKEKQLKEYLFQNFETVLKEMTI